MAGKRKDKSGRVLKTGENQRKNGTYDYRYTDGHGKVRCVYAKTLEALREKESTIQRDLADGIDYAAGEITASELVDRYMGLKRDIGPNTLRAYQTVVNRIRESDFGELKVRNVKPVSYTHLMATNMPIICRRQKHWQHMQRQKNVLAESN